MLRSSYGKRLLKSRHVYEHALVPYSPELADANICEFFARRLSRSADFAGFSIREYLIITSLTFDVQSQLGFPH